MSPEPTRSEETTPLLAKLPTRSIHSTTDHDALLTRQTIAIRVSVICILSVLVVEIGNYMLQAPLARTLEDILCRDYYSSAPLSGYSEAPRLSIPESHCKNDVIQGKLAMLRGWDGTLACIPGLIMSVPFGVLADKIGRKAVLFMSLIGIGLGLVWVQVICYFDTFFDIRWIWSANLFTLIGGGSAVARTMYYTIIADVVAEEQRATVFFQIVAASLIATLAGVPLAWWLIRISNLRVPMMAAVLFLFLGALLVLVLPETLHLREHLSNSSPDPDEAREEVMEDGASSTDNEGALTISKKNWSMLLENLEESRFVFTNPKLLALSATFLVQSLHGIMNQFLLQLASKRLGWTLADASFLIPLASITNFVQLVLVLPAIYAILSRLHLQAAVKDLMVSRGSALLMALGALGLAVSPLEVYSSSVSRHCSTTIIFSLGMGLYPAIRSLLTDLVDPTQVSRLYGVLAVMDTIGGMVSSPLVAGAFSSGLKRGGLWSGGGFLVAAVAYAAAGLLTLSVSVKKDESTIHEDVNRVVDEEL
ncbi:putative alternative oxidase protein [Botrytis fragariae]|uniref:Putative alternative oxidase protein n=1 Tax=Botrytis fragariae TaxID=1964551 RepID=A0A8H6APK6_9HELO|nr:putative alternative oxidase protein [Botrytis fragariae]KAF5871299.1 putative alternative oxidase protein [Botrytis fragariae]